MNWREHTSADCMKANYGRFAQPQALFGFFIVALSAVGIVLNVLDGTFQSIGDVVLALGVVLFIGAGFLWAARPTNYVPRQTSKVRFDDRGALTVRSSKRARIANAARETMFGVGNDDSWWELLCRFVLWPICLLVFYVRVIAALLGRAERITFHDDVVRTRYPNGKEVDWRLSVPLSEVTYFHTCSWIKNAEGQTLYLRGFLPQDVAALYSTIKGRAQALSGLSEASSSSDRSGSTP